jgi:hypothetical protein
MHSPQALESFYPSLATVEEVQSAIKRSFGDAAADILARMAAGTSPTVDAERLHDEMLGIITNEAGEDEVFYGSGSDGRFPITIRCFGPACFIQAQEFDDIGFFPTTSAARDFAEIEFEAYGPFTDAPWEDDEEEEDDS